MWDVIDDPPITSLPLESLVDIPALMATMMMSWCYPLKPQGHPILMEAFSAIESSNIVFR